MTRDRKWSRDGSRVFGDGHSFNTTNVVTAEGLLSVLTNYEIQINHHNTTNDKMEQCNRQLKQVLMDISILKSDIEELKETLNESTDRHP